MSQFSELLKEHINKKDITIKALAEKCGIDRTYLHKILKGERKVPNQAFVNNISLQLMLSAEDRSKLVELYNISEMGEDVYNRRRQVSKIIHDMANTNMEDADVLEFKTEVDIDTVPEISIYTDKRELRKNLQVLICSDVQKGSDIQVIAQPTDYLSSLLAATAEGSESVINHLFSLTTRLVTTYLTSIILIFSRAYVIWHKNMRNTSLFTTTKVRRHTTIQLTSCRTSS